MNEAVIRYLQGPWSVLGRLCLVLHSQVQPGRHFSGPSLETGTGILAPCLDLRSCERGGSGRLRAGLPATDAATYLGRKTRVRGWRGEEEESAMRRNVNVLYIHP